PLEWWDEPQAVRAAAAPASGTAYFMLLGGLDRRVGGPVALVRHGRRGRGRCRVVLRDLHRSALPDHRHLHLARVLEAVLDLAGDLVGEERRLVVVHVAWTHDHPDLA